MTVFAGIITADLDRPQQGDVMEMLSYVVAPLHTKFDSFRDQHLQLAVKQREVDAGFFADDNVCVVASGRLDDVETLRARLKMADEFPGIGKTIAKAYQEWGDLIVYNVFGEFAFVVWDKNKQLLLCGRDRFGQIPIAYRATKEGFAFASDFVSIAMGHASEPQINDDWIIGYLNETVLDHESTPFQGIRKLAPGSTIIWHDGEIKLHKYWSFSEIGPSMVDVSMSVITNELDAAIERRIISDTPAAMLSGGLDSSAIALFTRDLARKSSQLPLQVFSLVFDDFPDETERPYIESVLETGGFAPHFINVQEYDPISEISRHVRIQGAPHHGVGVPIHDQAIAELASVGHLTILDGHGGDEIISSGGFMRYFELASDGKWLKLLREMIRASRYSNINVLGNFIGLFGLKQRGFIARIARIFHNRLNRPSPEQPDSRLINLKWAEHASNSLADRIARESMPVSHSTERDYQENVLSSPLQASIFELLHRLFRSRGIRAEFPFWDYRVVEYCIRVPSYYKLRNGQSRSLIRSVMGNRFPPKIASRTTKYDFANAHIRSLQASADSIRSFAEKTDHKTFDYVNREVFVSAIDQLFSKKRQQRVEAHGKIWLTLNLFLWFEMIAEYRSKPKAFVGRQ